MWSACNSGLRSGVGSRSRDRRRRARHRCVRWVLWPGWCRLGHPRSRGGAGKGGVGGSHQFMRSNFLPGRSFANPTDFQLQLDGWCDRVNRRVHRTIRAVPIQRLAQEHLRMRPLPGVMPGVDRRFVTGVAQQPYVRVDRNDYCIDPAVAGRRVEVRRRSDHALNFRHRCSGERNGDNTFTGVAASDLGGLQRLKRTLHKQTVRSGLRAPGPAPGEKRGFRLGRSARSRRSAGRHPSGSVLWRRC